MTAVFFNLIVNATFSMACGLLVVWLFLWIFRVETGPWKLFLLSLPFAKIVYDSVRGLPPDSVLLAGIDPFSLPPKHQLLMAGAGFSYWGPIFNVVFGVRDTSGKEYAASVGDYLVIWLNRTFGTEVPLVILSVVVTVSVTLLAIRALNAYKFEKRRRLDRESAKDIRVEKLRLRSVDIYSSHSFSGTPFTGGVLKPYICIPEDALVKLESQELEAVIAHELGHIRQFDLAVTACVQLLGDFFWFVPGYRWLSRRIDRLREVVADQSAVRYGAKPLLLASALVKLKEIPETPDRFVLYSAFFREKSLLKMRVERLLGEVQDKRPRLGWRNIWFRALASIWMFTAVMIATLGGNHSTVKMKNPDWFQDLLKAFGFF